MGTKKNSNIFNSEFFGDNRWLFDICREGLLIQGGFWSPGLRNPSGQLRYFHCNSYSCTFLHFTHLHLFWGYSLDIFVVTFEYFWDNFRIILGQFGTFPLQLLKLIISTLNSSPSFSEYFEQFGQHSHLHPFKDSFGILLCKFAHLNTNTILIRTRPYSIILSVLSIIC